MPAELVTADELCIGSAWTHRLGRDGAAHFDVVLRDGRRLRSDDVTWVISRLVRMPEAYLIAADDADLAYAAQEWSALLCSVLRALALRGVPMTDAPGPFALSGIWRSMEEWAVLAARAGLPTGPARVTSDASASPAPDGVIERVLVVGERVFAGPRVDAQRQRACRRLAVLAQRSVLEVLTRVDGGSPTFYGVAHLPDVRIGGEPAIDALAGLLRP